MRDMVADHLSDTTFSVGDYVVEPSRNIIRHGAADLDGVISLQEIHLEPKVMDVLCALAERRGDVVPRTELIDRVWGVRYGGDESLTRAICILRKKFADRAKDSYIETVPKRGYRLIAPVQLAAIDLPSEAAHEAPPAPLLLQSAREAPPASRPFVRWRPRMIAAALALACGLAAMSLSRWAPSVLFGEVAESRQSRVSSAT